MNSFCKRVMILVIMAVFCLNTLTCAENSDGNPNPLASPKVIVFIDSHLKGVVNPEYMAETEITNGLLADGLRVVDPHQLQQTIEKEGQRYAASGNTAALTALAVRNDSDYILYGHIDGVTFNFVDGVYSYRLNSSIKVLRVDNGEVVATLNQSETGLGFTENEAAQKALVKLGTSISAQLHENIAKTLQAQTSLIQIDIRNVSSDEIYPVEAYLRQNNKIDDVVLEDYISGMAFFKIKTSLTVSELSGYLTSWNDLSFQVEGLTSGKLEMTKQPYGLGYQAVKLTIQNTSFDELQYYKQLLQNVSGIKEAHVLDFQDQTVSFQVVTKVTPVELVQQLQKTDNSSSQVVTLSEKEILLRLKDPQEGLIKIDVRINGISPEDLDKVEAAMLKMDPQSQTRVRQFSAYTGYFSVNTKMNSLAVSNELTKIKNLHLTISLMTGSKIELVGTPKSVDKTFTVTDAYFERVTFIDIMQIQSYLKKNHDISEVFIWDYHEGSAHMEVSATLSPAQLGAYLKQFPGHKLDTLSIGVSEIKIQNTHQAKENKGGSTL